MNRDLPPESVRAALDRVLASKTFRGAERSRTLLRFLVDEAMQGRADRLKDYVLGSEALGRGEQFDPRTDPIARVEASRLRARLDVYYATEGTGDPVRISLPKGGYAPTFAPLRPRNPDPGDPPSPPPSSERDRWLSPLAFGVVAFGLALAAAGGWQLGRTARPAVPEVRLDLVTPSTTDSISAAASPVGRSLVYVASTDGTSRLWIRPLDTGAARPLGGTEHASLPFWSPDGRSIGFFADSRIKRIDLDTGLVHTVSTALVPAGAAWNADGVLLHPIVPDSPLFRMSRDGAPLVPATQLAEGQTGHRGPVFLPDGRRFLFYASGDPAASGLYVGQLGTFATRRLVEADTPAVLAPPDHVLYVRHSTLFIHRIDLSTGMLAGGPTRVAEGVSIDALSGIAAVTASSDAIVYRVGAAAGKRQFVWRDRAGSDLARVGSPEGAGPSYASASPDGSSLAVQRTVSGNTDVLLMDVESGRSTRFTSHRQPDIAPHWSPQGERIAYSSLQRGVFHLFEKALGGEPRLLLDTPRQSKQITDWSRDGLYLLFRTVDFTTRADTDIWALPLDGDRRPFPVVRTPFEERDAQFSPDGRFIAYQSNESGRFEIYVQPFPGGGPPRRVSEGGGVQARWGASGGELFYLTLTGELVAAPIAIAVDGRSLRVGVPERLFRTGIEPVQGIALPGYLPSADGRKFLIDVVIDEVPPPFVVILNWNGSGL